MSIRKDIRQMTVAMIEGNVPTLAGKVYDSRAQTIDNKTTAQPACIVFTPAETSNEETAEMPQCVFPRVTTLHIELFAFEKNGATLAALFDDLEDEISALVAKLPDMLPGVDFVRLDSMELSPPTEETGNIQGKMILQYLVTQE